MILGAEYAQKKSAFMSGRESVIQLYHPRLLDKNLQAGGDGEDSGDKEKLPCGELPGRVRSRSCGTSKCCAREYRKVINACEKQGYGRRVVEGSNQDVRREPDL